MLRTGHKSVFNNLKVTNDVAERGVKLMEDYNKLLTYKAIRNNIVTKKTTELDLIFHKNLTKLDFFWPNMSQKSFKVLTTLLIFNHFIDYKPFI